MNFFALFKNLGILGYQLGNDFIAGPGRLFEKFVSLLNALNFILIFVSFYFNFLF
jgi:hypothetical protein